MRSQIIAAASLWAVVSLVAASGPGPMALEQLATGVYLHRGAHTSLDDPARADSANIGFVVGWRCVAVIDSGGALATGQAFATAIKTVTQLPVCYVINTHVHFDHVLGNHAFSGDSPKVVGHNALAEAMAANRDFFAQSFADELGGKDLRSRVIGPDLLVNGELDLDLGGRVLHLRAEATAHTNADLTIYDEQSGSLWAGDLLFRERMPVIDGSLKGWLAWMDRTMAQSYQLVVPGHGPPDRSWPSGASDQYRYLRALLEETREAIAAGLLLDEAQAGVATQEVARWTITARAHPRNISRVFRELEWE